MRERACIFIEADLYVPGLTDGAALHPELLGARVEVAKDAAAPALSWLEFQGRVGNNYRYRWTVPYELRNLADWTTARYDFQFSTDGTAWYQIAEGPGPDGGAARTLTRGFQLP